MSLALLQSLSIPAGIVFSSSQEEILYEELLFCSLTSLKFEVLDEVKMGMITKAQYEYAKERIEELLPVADEVNDKRAAELSVLSDIVIEYEKEVFPIGA